MSTATTPAREEARRSRATRSAGALLASIIAFVTFACSTSETTPPGTVQPAPTSGTIGVAGGRVTSSDGRVVVDVPPGAVDSDLTITIEAASTVPPGSVGAAYEIGPSGTTFKTPIGIAIAYDVGAYDGSPSALALATVVDGAWSPVSWAAVDPNARVVAGTTTHLSPYGLVPFPCLDEQKGGCFLAHQRCVRGIGPGGRPACGMPCRGDTDCPAQLFCIDGACLLRHCREDADCPTGLRCGGAGVCTVGCADGACPSTMICDGTPTGRACLRRSCYTGDSDCGPGGICFRRLNDTTSRSPGLCVSGPLGCDCADPMCPCVERDAGADAADAADAGCDPFSPDSNPVCGQDACCNLDGACVPSSRYCDCTDGDVCDCGSGTTCQRRCCQ